MNKTLTSAAVALLGLSLAACGNGSSKDSGASGTSGSYCDTITSVQSQVKSLDSISQADFDALTSKVTDIEASAPADVADDWKTLGDYLTQFNGLLKSSGISMDDLQSMQSGKLPPGVSSADVTKLVTQISSLSSSGDLDAADKAITASAKKDCNIDLNGSATTSSP
jgi:hypothetical protein